MPTTVSMPQLGESVAEGTIGRWLKGPGDAVAKTAHVRYVVEELKKRRIALIYQTTAYGQSGRRLLLADVPGLIEGAAEGAGLGHQFLRHLARTKLLLHLIDIAPPEEGADPVKDARAIVAELRKYDEALFKKSRWLILNKADLLGADERDKLTKSIVRRLRWKGPVFVISAISGAGCSELVHAIMNYLDSLPAVAIHAEDEAHAAA